MKAIKSIQSCLMAVLLFCGCKQKISADLIVHHAKIYTVDSLFSTAEAMVIKNGSIMAVGSNDMILGTYTAVNFLDAKQAAIFPGFIDAHCHFTGYSTDRWKCSLFGTVSFEDVIQKIKNYAKNAPQYWIYGTGWDQNDWTLKQFPDKKILDSLFPNRPVFLKRIDGHAALVNQVALNMANINEQTKINGGSIEIKNGSLTGILIDNAMSLIDHMIPPISDSLAIQYFVQTQFKCFSQGLTGVHDCGIDEHTLGLIEKAQNNHQLQIKIFALLSDSSDYYDRWIKKGPYKTNSLHVGGFKLYADGALGSRGACLLKDYSDKRGWKGFLLNNEEHFRNIAKKLAPSSFQMCTHAIGDSGNRTILKIYAEALGNKNDKRWRIEHAQVVDTNDLIYFNKYQIIPSVQPTHATSDMYWAASRLNENRIREAYAYQKLLQQNNWMPLGTDFPVEDISPFKTFFAAVVRKDAKGYPLNGFQINQALTKEQAIRGMTIWAAKAAFEEKEKGSIEKNKSADFILLNHDLMNCKESDILTTKVIKCYINGKLVYQQ